MDDHICKKCIDMSLYDYYVTIWYTCNYWHSMSLPLSVAPCFRRHLERLISNGDAMEVHGPVSPPHGGQSLWMTWAKPKQNLIQISLVYQNIVKMILYLLTLSEYLINIWYSNSIYDPGINDQKTSLDQMECQWFWAQIATLAQLKEL